MGLEVNRIEQEFIIEKIQDSVIPLRLNSRKGNITGKIIDYDSDKIMIESEDKNIRKLLFEDIRVFISFFGHIMTFESKVISVSENKLNIKYPKSLYKKLERKYERIKKPEGISVSFEIKSREIELDFPKTEFFNFAEKPDVADNFDISRIDLLVDQLKEKIIDYNANADVIMFRTRKPANILEELVAATGRIVYIPSTEKDLPDSDFSSSGSLMTKKLFVKFEQDHNKSGRFAFEELKKLLKIKAKEGIEAEIYCPIIFHEYVVGYIYIFLLKEKKNTRYPLDKEVIDFVHTFSKVLIYSLKIHGYFKGQTATLQEYKSSIIDISASGILFAHTSEEVSINLLIYSDIKLKLVFGNRKIMINSRIMRKFKENNISYYGVLFIDMAPEDFRFLFDYIYGRPFDDKDAETWEGGAPPPALSIT